MPAVYVANQGSGTVSVISTATNLVTQTVTVGGAPVFLAMNADGNRVYAVNQNGTVAVIDATIDAPGAAPAATLTVGSQPNFAIFDPRLLRVYVSNPGSNSVSIINADPLSAGFNSVTNVTVDAAPKSIAPLPDGTRAYVADSGAGTVNIINTLNNTVIRKITVGTTPVSIVASADSTKVFVANQGSNTLSVIRTSDDTVVATILAPLQDPTCNPAVSQCARM